MVSPGGGGGSRESDVCDAVDDALLATQRVLSQLRVKLAFATHLLESAAHAPHLYVQAYRPLSLPHRPPVAMQDTFGLTSAQLRLFLFASAFHDESILYNVQKSTSTALRAMQQQSPLWLRESSEPAPPEVPFPPAFLARFVLCTLSAVNVWLHAVASFATRVE